MKHRTVQVSVIAALVLVLYCLPARATDQPANVVGQHNEVHAVVEKVESGMIFLKVPDQLQPRTLSLTKMERLGQEDLKPEAERIKKQECAMCPKPDDTPVPPDLGPGSLLYGLGELFRLRQPDLADLFPRTTGGRTLSFLKKSGLEQTIQLVGAEVHRQYVLSFQPKAPEPGKFHAIRVVVRHRPELTAKTREGYWAVD